MLTFQFVTLAHRALCAEVSHIEKESNLTKLLPCQAGALSDAHSEQ